MLLYALTILVSAFLLFQVEPVIAKMILPWFGGSAAVWTTCLLFFQVVLLLGYLYAHLLIRFVSRRGQALVHIGLLFASLLVLPVVPGAGWKPSGTEDPTWRILLLLGATVGLPYFLLSTTGPLVQGWYARRFKGAVPYRLYALSNAGSMFALLSYPVLFEPVFATHQQAMGWSFGFAAFVLLCGATALVSRTGTDSGVLEEGEGQRPGAALYFFWIALPACASVLLLAITNHLSQNVAAIPFLWVLPLSLYLLSFILCFERSAWYHRGLFLRLLIVALGGMAYVLSEDFENASIKMLIPLLTAGLFVCSMVCHGELARLKPHPRFLTSYYVMISVGGALGGVLVGLMAPRLFQGYYELPAGLGGCALLVLLVLRRDPETSLSKGWKSPAGAVSAVLAAGFVIYLAVQTSQNDRDYNLKLRNFYGGLRITGEGGPSDPDAVRKLLHGTINHGTQFISRERRNWPTTYYGPESGVGLAIRERQEMGPMRVGVIGLGTGTLAAYGRAGDYYRFYEINPLVIELARTWFTYLGDSKAHVECALGDARLSLEREPQQAFDVLAVDAFSGDSIPVHLLTREAFALYRRHLAPGGVLAVHVSNKYLDLTPVVRMQADALGEPSMLLDTEDNDATGTFGATWVLISARQEFFAKPAIKAVAEEAEPKKGLRLWTDDYSNLFQILK
ncbi:MAG TPA: fused MFS/spermidine synthase [Bryobacteraceae bacterium]|nr:fused MFS/spermidine synthase [Bryobacteraceae bacterium]